MKKLTKIYVTTIYFLTCTLTLSSCFSCPDKWQRITRSANQFSMDVCVKRTPEPVTWSEGEKQCQDWTGHPMAWNETLVINQNDFMFNESEVWSSLIVKNSKLYHSGATETVGIYPFYVPNKSAPFQWGPAEPNLESGDCISLDRERTAKFTQCTKKMHMYCQRALVNPNVGLEPTFCPEGFIGSIQWTKCYKYFDKPMSYADASLICQNDGGGTLLTTEGKLFTNGSPQTADYEILDNVNRYFKQKVTQNPNQMIYWYKDPQQSCGIIDFNGENTSSKMSDDCTVRRPFMCEVDGHVNTAKTMELTVGVVLWTSDQMKHTQCNLSRPLSTGEKLFIYVSNRPLDFIYTLDDQKLQYLVDLSQVYPKVLMNGIHRCEVRGLHNKQIWSAEIYYQEPVTDSVFFRGSINVSPGFTSFDIQKFNLATDPSINPPLDVDKTLFQLQEQLNSAILSLNYNELMDTQISLSGSYSSTVDLVRDNGRTMNFKIMLELNTGSPYDASRELTTLIQMENYIKQYLSRRGQRRRRRAVEMTNFLPSTLEIKSSHICGGPTFIPVLDKIVEFPAVTYGSDAISSDICITDKKPLVTATCSGGVGKPTELTDIIVNPKCIFSDLTTSAVSDELKKLTTSKINSFNVKFVVEILKNLTADPNILTSLDVISIADILVAVSNISSLDEQTLSDIIDTINNVLNVDPVKLKIAQEDGSATNRILEVLDDVSRTLDLQGESYAQFLRENLLMEVYDLSSLRTPVVGIQIKEGKTHPLTNSTIKTVMDGTDVYVEKVDAAIILPIDLINNDINATRVVLNIYRNWELFSVRSDVKDYLPNSRIMSAYISVDGIPVRSLGQHSVQAYFFPRKEVNNSECGYWNYDIHDTSGGWATDGCKLNRTESGRYVCICDHLTNFAVLVNIGGQDTLEDSLAISIISWIGLGLSILGLSLTILSFFLFKHLRKGRAQQTLFNLALSLLCFLIVFIVGIEQTQDYNGCIAVAVLLHYFILVAFMWMLMEGILQYLRFVKVLGTYIPHFILKTAIPAWGIPLIPVIIVLGLDYHLYKGGSKACWMSLSAFYYAFVIPIAVIVLANIIIFFMILKNLLGRPKGLQSNQSEKKRAIMNLRAAISVLVLLGLTWIFGFFTIEKASIVFQYIFTILNVFQGFLIFILFTAREKQVRQSWKKLCCKQKTKEKYVKCNTTSGENTKGKPGHYLDLVHSGDNSYSTGLDKSNSTNN